MPTGIILPRSFSPTSHLLFTCGKVPALKHVISGHTLSLLIQQKEAMDQFLLVCSTFVMYQFNGYNCVMFVQSTYFFDVRQTGQSEYFDAFPSLDCQHSIVTMLEIGIKSGVDILDVLWRHFHVDMGSVNVLFRWYLNYRTYHMKNSLGDKDQNLKKKTAYVSIEYQICRSERLLS